MIMSFNIIYLPYICAKFVVTRFGSPNAIFFLFVYYFINKLFDQLYFCIYTDI